MIKILSCPQGAQEAMKQGQTCTAMTQGGVSAPLTSSNFKRNLLISKCPKISVPTSFCLFSFFFKTK